MLEPAGYDDEIICLGKGGVYRLREMARREVGPEELVVSNPAPFLEGVEIYAQEPQGRGYCYVPGDSKSSVVLVTALGDTGAYGEMVLENDFAVRKLQYSPLGSYLLVLTVYEQGRNENNLKVFKLKSEEGIFLLFSFPFKTNSAKVLSTWPPYRWSSDEVLVFKVQDTSVSIFRGDTESLENPIGTLNFPKSIQLSVSNMVSGRSRESSLNFIVVTPQSSQNMDIFVYRAEMDDLKDIQLSSVGRLCISEAQSCQVSWNCQGDSALIFAQIEGETLGKSYFGSSSLHLVRMQNTKTVVASGVWGASSRTGPPESGSGAGSASEAFRPSERWSLRHQVVVPPEEGPVNDVAWSPTSNEFLLCKGVIPPELTLNSGIDGSPKGTWISGTSTSSSSSDRPTPLAASLWSGRCVAASYWQPQPLQDSEWTMQFGSSDTMGTCSGESTLTPSTLPTGRPRPPATDAPCSSGRSLPAGSSTPSPSRRSKSTGPNGRAAGLPRR
ncbi:eIF-3A like translation initiation factor [Cryptosporidium canis]|uniref:EIF-3A like translation initiation factor n=1 Tax=Cryptosporidium canis TaxID=195482 RepID=A0ABQ8PBT2_9CRYT|nr:eIF-3A like translation initiation factor [Cryptosporidium canis]KAJ1615416.1 eIF-3A like translation initiation factor [Cryptosporidium canis]